MRGRPEPGAPPLYSPRDRLQTFLGIAGGPPEGVRGSDWRAPLSRHGHPSPNLAGVHGIWGSEVWGKGAPLKNKLKILRVRGPPQRNF